MSIGVLAHLPLCPICQKCLLVNVYFIVLYLFVAVVVVVVVVIVLSVSHKLMRLWQPAIF